MSPPPVIDTDILIDVARQVAEAVSYLSAIEADAMPVISAVTETVSGAAIGRADR